MSLNLYKLKKDYYNYLIIANIKNVALKKDRLYLGVVVDINNYKYFAPLSSPKLKHKNMKNSKDFMKIDRGDLGAINFNNMVPVDLNDIEIFNFGTNNNDTKETVQYKNLVKKQFIWCNKNKETIEEKATRLYNYMLDISNSNKEEYKKLKARCCNFKLCENKLQKYLNDTNIHKIHK